MRITLLERQDPPNACRGERRGVGGAGTTPIKPVFPTHAKRRGACLFFPFVKNGSNHAIMEIKHFIRECAGGFNLY